MSQRIDEQEALLERLSKQRDEFFKARSSKIEA
jgi:hypothetical protein